jgi:hypothetical protein
MSEVPGSEIPEIENKEGLLSEPDDRPMVEESEPDDRPA